MIFFHNAGNHVNGHLGIYLAVDGNSGSDAAGADAAQGIDGKQAVSGSLTGLDTQDFGELVDDLLGALNIAGSTQAAANDILALGLQGEEGIEGDNTVDLCNGDAGLLGYDLLNFQRNVSIFILDVAEDHHQGRLLICVSVADLTNLLDAVFTYTCHICLQSGVYFGLKQ